MWINTRKLQNYWARPSPEQAILLRQAFDTLFETETGYEALDKRIAKTKAKRDKL